MTSEGAKRDRIVLNQVNLVVGNMAAAVDFYQLLGLDIPATEPGWDENHRSVATGSEVSDEIEFDLDSRQFAAYWGGAPDETIPTGPVLGIPRRHPRRSGPVVLGGHGCRPYRTTSPVRHFLGRPLCDRRRPGRHADRSHVAAH